MARVLVQADFENIVARYNNTYVNLTNSSMSPAAKEAVAAMRADLFTLMNEVNDITGDTGDAVTAFGIDFAGFGIYPAITCAIKDVYTKSGATLNFDGSTLFSSITPLDTYTESGKPAWMTLNASTGAMTGTVETVTATKTYKITVGASNDAGVAPQTVEVRLIIEP